MQSDRMQDQRVEIGGLQIGIILLTLATAVIHGIVLNVLLQEISIPFTLNAIGYVVLLALYFLPIPLARNNRNLVRWALMGFTAVTIILWVAIGEKSFVGYLDKAIEVVLLVLLWMDRS